MAKKINEEMIVEDTTVIAKVKIGDDGRCVSINGDYTAQDVVIDRTFVDAKEALQFYAVAQDYVYKDGSWTLDPLPIPAPEPTPLELLQQENHLLKAQVNALTEQGEFQDELIAELATIVYA